MGEKGEIAISKDVLKEFKEIVKARGGYEKVPLSDALGLYIAVMIKHTCGFVFSDSPYMLRKFYDEIVLPQYRDKGLIERDLDKSFYGNFRDRSSKPN